MTSYHNVAFKYGVGHVMVVAMKANLSLVFTSGFDRAFRNLGAAPVRVVMLRGVCPLNLCNVRHNVHCSKSLDPMGRHVLINPSSLLHCLPHGLYWTLAAWSAAVQIHSWLAGNGLPGRLAGSDTTSSQGQACPCYRPAKADGRLGLASRSRSAAVVPMQKPAHETCQISVRSEHSTHARQARAAHAGCNRASARVGSVPQAI